MSLENEITKMTVSQVIEYETVEIFREDASPRSIRDMLRNSSFLATHVSSLKETWSLMIGTGDLVPFIREDKHHNPILLFSLKPGLLEKHEHLEDYEVVDDLAEPAVNPDAPSVILIPYSPVIRQKPVLAVEKNLQSDNENPVIVDSVSDIPASDPGNIQSADNEEEISSVSHAEVLHVQENEEIYCNIFGYRIRDGKAVVVEKEADVIRTVFECLAKNMVLSDIADQLNQKKCLTRTGRPYTYGTVYAVKKCESLYYGDGMYLNKYPLPAILEHTAEVPDDSVQVSEEADQDYCVIYGYQIVNGVAVIQKKEAEVVRIICSWSKYGESYTRIADYLNSVGYCTRTGKPFKNGTVYQINRGFTHYTGTEKYLGKYPLPQIWDPSDESKIMAPQERILAAAAKKENKEKPKVREIDKKPEVRQVVSPTKPERFPSIDEMLRQEIMGILEQEYGLVPFVDMCQKSPLIDKYQTQAKYILTEMVARKKAVSIPVMRNDRMTISYSLPREENAVSLQPGALGRVSPVDSKPAVTGSTTAENRLKALRDDVLQALKKYDRPVSVDELTKSAPALAAAGSSVVEEILQQLINTHVVGQRSVYSSVRKQMVSVYYLSGSHFITRPSAVSENSSATGSNDSVIKKETHADQDKRSVELKNSGSLYDTYLICLRNKAEKIFRFVASGMYEHFSTNVPGDTVYFNSEVCYVLSRQSCAELLELSSANTASNGDVAVLEGENGKLEVHIIDASLEPRDMALIGTSVDEIVFIDEKSSRVRQIIKSGSLA